VTARSALISDLLPPGVVAVDAPGEPPDGLLLPEEEQAVAHAVPQRVRDFTAVRTCARTALGRLGLPPGPLVPGPAGEPLWPVGVVGSMTHCDGYRAAAVARRTALHAVGIDAEPHRRLPPGVAGQVLLPWERDHTRVLPDEVRWDRLVFSAKESVFKAWFPLTGSWLGFEEALVEPRPHHSGDPLTGTLVVQLLVAPGRRPPCWPPVVTGAYAVRRGLVLTALAL
jgi:4'-phosphopantetheinyl transferase EntD